MGKIKSFYHDTIEKGQREAGYKAFLTLQEQNKKVTLTETPVPHLFTGAPLFVCIDTNVECKNKKEEQSFLMSHYDLWFSEKLQLYVQIIDGTDVCYFKPLDSLEELGEDEALLIRKTLNLKPAQAITYRDLFDANYIDELMVNSKLIIAKTKDLMDSYEYKLIDLQQGQPDTPKTGTFTDHRDGKVYRTVKIGNQTMFAENLNYDIKDGSWCYDNDDDNGNKYGRLYNWQTAKIACPKGWHIPSESEYETLISDVGGEGNYGYHALIDGGSSGFSALLGGFRSSNGSFYDLGKYGNWWSSTEFSTNFAWLRYLSAYTCTVGRYELNKEDGLSVRCFQD